MCKFCALIKCDDDAIYLVHISIWSKSESWAWCWFPSSFLFIYFSASMIRCHTFLSRLIFCSSFAKVEIIKIRRKCIKMCWKQNVHRTHSFNSTSTPIWLNCKISISFINLLLCRQFLYSSGGFFFTLFLLILFVANKYINWSRNRSSNAFYVPENKSKVQTETTIVCVCMRVVVVISCPMVKSVDNSIQIEIHSIHLAWLR